MITQASVERIISAANIIDVIGSEVTLKRSGVNYKACCPFHNESTPSFMVNEAKQIFKCFGCGEGGNVVTYLMKHNSLTFPEAIMALGKRYSIDPEYEKDDDDRKEKRAADDKLREGIIYVNEMAARFYASQLAGFGMEYLLIRMPEDDIAAWHLGWAPEGWDHLLNHFREKGVREEMMLASGLIRESEKTGKLYDYFRGRVIFPIHNTAGRVVAFAGRITDPGSKEPKYINSIETVAYNKSQVLYGMNQAYRGIKERKTCNLVEGYTDVIAMHRAGIANTVAACGTSVTEQQLQLISRYTRKINLVGDGDTAGIKSMMRTGSIALRLGMEVTSVMLPSELDPYDIIQHYQNDHE
jgi:DNA primase